MGPIIIIIINTSCAATACHVVDHDEVAEDADGRVRDVVGNRPREICFR